MVAVRADPQKIYPKYLFAALRSSVVQSQIDNMHVGTMIPHFKKGDFGKLKIPVLRSDAQKVIGDFYFTVSERITLLRETNATLEAIAQALFKSWFVDFDPVRAKAEGRQPEGMDASTATLFPDSFEESELGLVPKGWVVKPVGDAVDCLGGGTPDTKEPSYWEPAEHCWTTPKDLSGLQSPVLLQTERHLSTLGLAKVSSGLLPAGTLLLSSRAPIGYLAIAQIMVAVNQGYIAIPPGGELSPLYMLFWCRQNMEAIKGRANGSTFMEISKKAFRPIPALVPSAEVLDEFTSMAGPLFERLVENERRAQTLTQLRDTLLPRLISGQLRLPEAQALLEKQL
jgi:type I restriction enzyme S subunit